MSKDKTTMPAMTISQAAARLSFTTAVTFVVLHAALHFLEPGFDPSWRFISEYALGRYGWIMTLAFLSLAVSYAALFMAIQSQLRTIIGRIGLALLLISAVSFVMAGIFPTDPITTSPDAATTSGMLHNVGATLGIAMTFAALIISWSLARNPTWFMARQSLLWTAGIAVACSVGFIAYVMAVLPSDGIFSPDVLAGGIGRMEILAYSAWLMVASRQAIKLGK